MVEEEGSENIKIVREHFFKISNQSGLSESKLNVGTRGVPELTN